MRSPRATSPAQLAPDGHSIALHWPSMSSCPRGHWQLMLVPPDTSIEAQPTASAGQHNSPHTMLSHLGTGFATQMFRPDRLSHSHEPEQHSPSFRHDPPDDWHFSLAFTSPDDSKTPRAANNAAVNSRRVINPANFRVIRSNALSSITHSIFFIYRNHVRTNSGMESTGVESRVHG